MLTERNLHLGSAHQCYRGKENPTYEDSVELWCQTFEGLVSQYVGKKSKKSYSIEKGMKKFSVFLYYLKSCPCKRVVETKAEPKVGLAYIFSGCFA